MQAPLLILSSLAVVLAILNIYQFLVLRAALRISEILYVMGRNVRAKAAEVRRSKKDVEIIEAHLFDMVASTRSLLRVLGRREREIDPDPALTVATTEHGMDSDNLMRLADNVFFAVREELPQATWDEVLQTAQQRFQEKVPHMDREGARRIVNIVAKEHRNQMLQKLHREHFDGALIASSNGEE
ncbi:MAG: hypothetical protein AB1505_04550 [Candidatus Latescibacterota bacterium]